MPRSPQLHSPAPRRTAAWRAWAAGAVAVTLSWTGPSAAAAAPAVTTGRGGGTALVDAAAAAAPGEVPPDPGPGTAAEKAATVPAEAPAAAAAPPEAPAAALAPQPATAPPAPSPADVAPPADVSPPAAAAPADESTLVVQNRPAAADPLGSRLIDVATPSTIGRRRLEALFTHRFNQPVNQGGNAHNLWGLDSGADVGFGFTYGLLRRLDLSAYRSQFQEDYELAGKLQVLDQSARIPLSAAVRAGADLLGRKGVADPHRPFVQLLLGRRLAAGWNVFVSPSWVRATPLLRNAWNVPVGLTVPLPGKWLLEGEVIAANHALRDVAGASRLAWHAAFARQIGWHIFQIVLGDSRATTVDQIVGGDFAGGFNTHDVRLGFNLVRYFSP